MSLIIWSIYVGTSRVAINIHYTSNSRRVTTHKVKINHLKMAMTHSIIDYIGNFRTIIRTNYKCIVTIYLECILMLFIGLLYITKIEINRIFFN